MATGKTNKNSSDRNRHSRAGILARLLQALLAALIIALGIFAAGYLIKMKKPPQRKEIKNPPPLVQVVTLAKRDIRMLVRGHGTVSPKVKVDIIPEVPGKVVYVHPQLKAGGFIPADREILRIDPRDYQLAEQQAKAAVAEAQVRLDTERAEALVARKEWEGLHPDSEPNSPLVLREPQIRRAQASLESAKAQLAISQLKLERTTLALPFDALITDERVDLGQYVVVGQPLGSAYGIESVEIEVPLEDEDLAWFNIFENTVSVNGNNGSAEYIAAQVKARFAGAEHTWPGRVVRTTGQVDRTSRMVSVVVEVAEPYDISGGRPPLLPGAFVEVLIEGAVVKDALAVPRDAVREANKVWLVEDGKMHVTELKILRADKDFAYVASGLEDGARIVLSSIDIVVDGMEIRVQPDNAETDRRADEPNKAPAKSEVN